MGKFSELLEVSDPKQGILNAKKYFNNPNVTIYLSPEKNKKYAVINPYTNKLVLFGQTGYEDYTKHHDEQRRINYLKRASNIKGN